MPHTASVGTAAAAPETPHRISIRQRAGVWRVALNDDFYGDYARRYWALEAAFEIADDIAAGGGAAVITSAMDGQQDAEFQDTRRPAARDEAERIFAAGGARARAKT